jgi:hypothetical protein
LSDERPLSASAILGAARAAIKEPRAERPTVARRRHYPALEARVGETLPAMVAEPVRAFRGEALSTSKTALIKADITRRSALRASENQTTPKRFAAKMQAQTQGLTAHQKFQQLIEKTVKTLLVTASQDGDLAFRADIDAGVMSDLSVDVMYSPRGLEIAFYTEDTGTRRLLQGYERDLVAHLRSRGLKVARVRYEREPDPNEAPPVPIKR